MVEKPYEWPNATLDDHSRRKHQIVRQYFQQYVAVRCQLPQQAKFKLAIVDGFSGGGMYKCGAPGSPLIFIEELRAAAIAANLRRSSEGMSPLDIDCLLVLNDSNPDAIEFLKTLVAPREAEIKESAPRLHLRVEYAQQEFEHVYPEIKGYLLHNGFGNVLFNLDQCGHSHVDQRTLNDIMTTFSRPEIFYTMMISSLLAFLRKNDPDALNTSLAPLGVQANELSKLEGLISREQWLGTAERLVFDAFKGTAKFVSPFSINNPDGWRYWLMHFSNSPRAVQVYNDVLHANSSAQAHFGRPGLHMLSYDPSHEGKLYLFDEPDREIAIKQLHDDIPRLVSQFGDAVSVNDFYETIYNATPAHTDDIRQVLIDNTDLQVITERGGKRSSINTIKLTDTLRLKRQRSFSFSMPPKKSNK